MPRFPFTFALLLLFALLGSTSAFYKYTSSYAFLNVRSMQTPPRGVDFCVNFQQWRSRDLPISADVKPHSLLSWWNQTLNTDICNENRHKFASDDLVPADYRTIKTEVEKCIFFNQSLPVLNSTGALYERSKNFIQHHQIESIILVNRMMSEDVVTILFLMDKGKSNAYNLHNYLFSQFYNADINDSVKAVSVFYVYRESFEREIRPFALNSSGGGKGPEFRFYQPQSGWPMDPAVFVLWLFAAVSILIGSLWAAAETKSKLAEKGLITATAGQPEDGPKEQQVNVIANTEEERKNEETPTGSSEMKDIQQPIEEVEPKSALVRSQSEEIARMSGCQHCTTVLIALIFVVIVLMLAFFFREYAVLVFNVLLLFLGTISVNHCLYALYHQICCGWEYELPTLREWLCCGRKQEKESVQHLEIRPEDETVEDLPTSRARNNALDEGSASTSSTAPLPASARPTTISSTRKSVGFIDRPTKLISSIIFAFSFAFCTVWFVFRNHHNAFYLLDLINVMVCIYAVKTSRIRSLRLLTFLLLAMFGYDLFMVFGTKLLTPDGCSVMLQVVTGVDCQQKRATASAAHSGKSFQPVAPIDQHDIPEKIPLLFYVPMLADPMRNCFDVEVEREYKHVMLGLGDIIIPGYLIAFCFYVDVVKRSRFYTYGLIVLIGYSLGMISTFVALMLMETGQPALIYLVPFTLVPIFCWALLHDGKQMLAKMWRGEL